MMDRALRCCAVAALVAGACSDTDSATNLNPEGPPMIRQVRMQVNSRLDNVFAFGTHPLATTEEIQPNLQNATASKQVLRIVVDELLVGNNLEEIACRGPVDDDAYARVPVGATPDDIARCSVPDDALPSSCSRKDKFSVCLCANTAGCIRGVTPVNEGDPVGVLDLNLDGATDDTRGIAGAVGIQCGSIAVPINLDLTYWNPSGDQNRPAIGGFDALGPAVVVQSRGALPTNVECGLVFSEEVVDKQGNQICAPADGDIAAGCTPGDVSAFKFKVEPLVVIPSTFREGETGVAKAGPFVFESNAPLDAASLTAIAISPPPAGAVTISLPMPQLVRIDVAGGLAATTMYTVTFPASVKDSFAQPLPAARVFHFTTGA
jgi:hypothetical protein